MTTPAKPRMVPAKSPKGEKPETTIKIQANEIRNLTLRCEDLLVQHGRALGEAKQLDERLRAASAQIAAKDQQIARAQADLQCIEREMGKLEGWINRVREVENRAQRSGVDEGARFLEGLRAPRPPRD